MLSLIQLSIGKLTMLFHFLAWTQVQWFLSSECRWFQFWRSRIGVKHIRELRFACGFGRLPHQSRPRFECFFANSRRLRRLWCRCSTFNWCICVVLRALVVLQQGGMFSEPEQNSVSFLLLVLCITHVHFSIATSLRVSNLQTFLEAMIKSCPKYVNGCIPCIGILVLLSNLKPLVNEDSITSWQKGKGLGSAADPNTPCQYATWNNGKIALLLSWNLALIILWNLTKSVTLKFLPGWRTQATMHAHFSNAKSLRVSNVTNTKKMTSWKTSWTGVRFFGFRQTQNQRTNVNLSQHYQEIQRLDSNIKSLKIKKVSRQAALLQRDKVAGISIDLAPRTWAELTKWWSFC